MTTMWTLFCYLCLGYFNTFLVYETEDYLLGYDKRNDNFQTIMVMIILWPLYLIFMIGLWISYVFHLVVSYLERRSRR